MSPEYQVLAVAALAVAIALSILGGIVWYGLQEQPVDAAEALPRWRDAEIPQPCPFCGSVARLWIGTPPGRYVACDDGQCAACGPTRPTDEAAILAWNSMGAGW